MIGRCRGLTVFVGTLFAASSLACSWPGEDEPKPGGDTGTPEDSGDIDTGSARSEDTGESEPRDTWRPPGPDTGPFPWKDSGDEDENTGPTPVGAEPTHGASDLELATFPYAAYKCAPGARQHDQDEVVVMCGGDLYFVQPRSAVVGTVLTSKGRSLAAGATSADIDGDGVVDLLLEGGDVGLIAWGPVSGSATLESIDALYIPETKESGSVEGDFGVVTEDGAVVQWGVEAGGQHYIDGRAYFFPGGSRLSSPLDVGDAEGQIVPTTGNEGDDVEDLFNAGDFDGDGFSDLAMQSASFWADPTTYDDDGGYAIHLGPVTGTVDVDDGAVWMPTGDDLGVYLDHEGGHEGDVDGDGYDDALVNVDEEVDGSLYDYLCFVGGEAAPPGEIEACPVSGSARMLVSEEGGGFYITRLHDLDGDGTAEILTRGWDVATEERIWVMSGPVSGLMYAEDEARSIVGPGEYPGWLNSQFRVVSDETGPLLAIGVWTGVTAQYDLVFLDASGL